MAVHHKSVLGLRERNKQDKLQRIRKAARTLFRQQGFEATTIAQIAEAAEVAKGTIFLYARDKEELLFLVFMEDLAAAVEQGLSSLPDAPLVEQMVHLFQPLLQLYSRDSALALLFIRELLILKDDRLQDYNDLTTGFLLRIAALLDAGVARRELAPDLDTLLAAHNIFGVYAFMLLTWLQDQRPNVALGGDMLRRSFALLWRGMAADRAAQIR